MIALALGLFPGPTSAHELPFITLSVERGLPRSQVSALSADTSGALWVATLDGLSRFDGLSFETVPIAGGLSDARITAMVQDGEGRLWIGTERGLVLRDHTGVHPVPSGLAASALVRALLSTSTGEMWVGTERGLLRYDRRTLAPLPAVAALDGIVVSALVEDRKGRVWVGTASRGIGRFDDGRLSFLGQPAPGGSRVLALKETRDGRVWIGTDAGVLVHDGERLSVFPLLEPGPQPVVHAILEDAAGALWLGTGGRGLARLYRGELTWFTAEDGLGASTVLALALDREGGVWAGTYRGGLSLYLGFERLPSLIGRELDGVIIRAVFEDRKGRLWFATDDRGVAWFDGTRLRWLRARDGLSHDFVLTVFEDRSGALWFGTQRGLTRYDGRSFRRFDVADGLPGEIVRSVVEDRTGAIWAGTNAGAARLDGDSFRSFRTGGGAEEAVSVLHVDHAGRLRSGGAQGLSLFQGDHFSSASRALLLPEGSVYSIVQHPKSGDLWVGVFGKGLVKVSPAALDTPRGSPAPGPLVLASRDIPGIERVVSLTFDPAGGLWAGTETGLDLLHLQQLDASGGYAVSHWGTPHGPEWECVHNASLVDRAGRVWVGTVSGPILFDPRRQVDVAAPLSVSLTGAGPAPGETVWTARGRGAAATSVPSVELGPGANDAAFAFEAISLSAPRRVRFQYKLEGYDGEWSPVTTTTHAFYTELPPGDFTFRVRATRDGRTWFEAPRPFRLRVAAPVWQRTWFQAFGLFAIVALLYGGHRLSVARLRAHERELQAEVRQRERAEGDLARTNRALRVLGECNLLLVRAEDESLLLDDACRLVVDIGGYRLCWVGWAEDDQEKTVRPVAVAGEDRGYVASARVSWADTDRGRGPTGVAIRTARAVVSRDLGGDPDFGPWREEARTLGFRSSIAVPIAREGRVLGALNIYSTDTDAFHDQEVELLSELAADLAFGIGALRTRLERERAEQALKESETRFRTLAETSVSAIFAFDEDDRFTYVNPALERITGYAASELIGKSFWELLPPESRQLAGTRRDARERGEPLVGRYEIAFRNRAGELRWIDLGVGFVGEKGGRIAVATAFDITERRRAQKAVKERVRLAVFAAEVATALTRAGTLGEILQRCCESIVEHLNAALGRVWVLEAGGDFLELQGSAGLYTHADGTHSRIPVGRFAVGLIAQEGRPHVTNAVAEDLRVHDQDWVRREGLVSFAGHPLIVEGRLVGVIAMFSRRTLSEATLQALEAVAKVVASAIDRKRVEEAGVRSERRFRALIENSSDLVSVLDATGRIRYASPSTARVLGFAPEELLDESLLDLVHSEDRSHARSLVKELLEERGRSVTGEFRLRNGSGEWRWLGVTGRNLLGEPAVEGLVLNFRDTTAQKQAEAQLQHDALHDALTGLPNRALLVERLEHAVARSRRYPTRRFAVLFLDLDGFKFVNDSLGHEAGDSLLVALAPRIESCLRSSDTCARLGGDEFVVLLDEVGDAEGAVEVAERIQQQLGAPFSIGGREVTVSTSLGIVIGSDGYQRADDILRDADIAMYRAKARGRSRHEIFDVGMRRAAVARLAFQTALRQAIEQQQLCVFYQPIVSLDSGRLAGFEALVRWLDPERGLVLPDDFVPVAEEGTLIVSIDRWVLREACRQLGAWRRSLPAARSLTMNVNVSSRHFTGSHLAQEIRSLLAESGLEPSSLELEITESTIMDNVPVVTGVLGELKRLGVRVAIDDFGTGYSSLAYLARLPVDTLKIDRTFVGHLDGEGGSGEIVGTIVTLAHSLGMRVIAEGVETLPQRTRLRDLGCERAQGYLIARPLVADEVSALIAAESVGPEGVISAMGDR